MADIFHMARQTLTWFIKQGEIKIRKISGKVKAIPISNLATLSNIWYTWQGEMEIRKILGKVKAISISNLARLNNIWYTWQVISRHGIKPAGFMRYMDYIWPVRSNTWVIRLQRIE